MTDSRSKSSGTWRAVLLLFVAATVIPEVLIGSTPLSRLNTLVFQFPLYGSAALVIREAVIRFGLGRAGLVVLGLAYGVTIEGLALQSLFNPHFLNFDITYGRAGEVNWPWALYMVGYHALWSVAIPVTLAELIFPQRATEPWLGRIGVGVFGTLLVLMVFAFHAIFVKMSGFTAPFAWYAGAAGVVALLVALGLQLKRREPSANTSASSASLPGLFALLLGLLWLMLYGDIFRHPHLLPVAGNLAAGLGVAVSGIILSRKLTMAARSPLHRLSFVAGGLAANTLFGFVVVSGSARIDLYGQIAFVVMIGAGLYWLGRKIRPSPAS